MFSMLWPGDEAKLYIGTVFIGLWTLVESQRKAWGRRWNLLSLSPEHMMDYIVAYAYFWKDKSSKERLHAHVAYVSK